MVISRHAQIREATNYVQGGDDTGPVEWPATATLPSNYGFDR